MSKKRIIKKPKQKSSRGKKNNLSFLPEGVQVFIARRFMDMWAAGFMAAGLFMLISLLSYNHADPSWNTAASVDAIHNFGGAYGAWVADLFLQTIGVGSFAFAGCLVIWSLRYFKRHDIGLYPVRVAALLIAALGFSVAFAQIPSGGWLVHPYMGASAGTLLFTQLSAVPFLLGAFGIPLIAGLISALLFLFAVAIRKEEIIWTLETVRLSSLFVIGVALSTVMHFIDWVQHYNQPKYATAGSAPQMKFSERLAALRPKKTEPVISPTTLERAIEPASPGIETPPAPPPAASEPIPVVTTVDTVKKTATALANQQPRLNLNEGLGETPWELPNTGLLQEMPADAGQPHMNEDALRRNAELLQNVLLDFNIEGDITSIHPGPVVTLYELEPAPGVKSSRVISLADDIARSMSAVSVRIAVVPGRNVIGIELPNKTRQTVYMQELLEAGLFEKAKAALPLILGKDIGGQPITADLAKMPHLLVAGTTGSGKSVAVNTMILSLLFSQPPEKCRFIMIDPKMLELSVYNDIPHLLSPVVTEPGKAVVSLKWAVNEMEERYRAMSKLGVRNIDGYNARMREAQKKGETIMQKVQTGFEPDTGAPIFEDQPMDMTELPYIVIIVDEFADLMLVAGKDVEGAIQRLAQMARAAGIHLIMATQRPSVDVITGVIKANFPTRISFAVTSKVDSRTILGEGGAEQLLGMGDMLYMAPGGRITRVHGPFVSDSDVEQVCEFLRGQGAPAYVDSVTDEGAIEGGEVMDALFGGGDTKSSDVDELYDQAVALVAREGKASTSFVQRYLQIGYNRAARIIEEMERQGVISKATATGKREVLVRDHGEGADRF